jgi:hypothetical protein
VKQADAEWKQEVLASWLGFNVDGEGLKSIVGVGPSKGMSATKSKHSPPPGETTKEWKRLASAFAKLR